MVGGRIAYEERGGAFQVARDARMSCKIVTGHRCDDHKTKQSLVGKGIHWALRHESCCALVQGSTDESAGGPGRQRERVESAHGERGVIKSE